MKKTQHEKKNCSVKRACYEKEQVVKSVAGTKHTMKT